MVNLLFHHAALLLAPSASSTSGLGAQSVNGLVSMLLDLNDRGYALAGAVLALCLLPLGSPAYRSSRLPRVIGALLVVSLGVSTRAAYALPGLPALVQQALAPPPIADFWLVLYLVARAVCLTKRPAALQVADGDRSDCGSSDHRHDRKFAHADLSLRITAVVDDCSGRPVSILRYCHTDRLAELGVSRSVGSRGDSYDNAAAESLNSLYKRELIDRLGPWNDLADVTKNTMNWVAWYNSERLHSHCDGVPPFEYEEAFHQVRTTAA